MSDQPSYPFSSNGKSNDKKKDAGFTSRKKSEQPQPRSQVNRGCKSQHPQVTSQIPQIQSQIPRKQDEEDSEE